MITLQVIPIFIPDGNSGPMSESDIKGLLGAWIVLNALWIIGWIITFFRWIYEKPDSYTKRKESIISIRLDVLDGLVAIIADGSMVIMWAIILILFSGELIGKLL